MDRDKALEAIRKMIHEDHWFGEGAGGSGHLASVGLGNLEIISQEEAEFQDQPCIAVVCACSVDRESEFGGESRRYKKRRVLSRSGKVLDRQTLEEKVFDLLTGEEREGFLGLLDV